MSIRIVGRAKFYYI